MPTLIAAPSIVAAAGTRPKRIEEFAGRINSGHAQVSVARMTSPEGWEGRSIRKELASWAVLRCARYSPEKSQLPLVILRCAQNDKGEWVRQVIHFL